MSRGVQDFMPARLHNLRAMCDRVLFPIGTFVAFICGKRANRGQADFTMLK